MRRRNQEVPQAAVPFAKMAGAYKPPASHCGLAQIAGQGARMASAGMLVWTAARSGIIAAVDARNSVRWVVGGGDALELFGDDHLQ